ncbi:MAG: TolC family protein [Ferruginibacter sp.]|nr:TolC family protein [Bacteroidota bacterium]MBX2919197.1 TolC family protein [Ferruginibacter sp.]MCB0709361.1 TolC family protein [Chitinophagaceae bacterium]
MRIIKIAFAFLFFTSNAFSQENKFTLNQCIETALHNNTLVKQAGLRADAAGVNLKQAKNNLLPAVNGSFNYGFQQGRSVNPITNSYINQQLNSSNVGLNGSITLFNGMRLQNIIKQNRFAYDASKMDEQQEKDNLRLNVILAYLQVLSNEDVLAIGKEQVEVTKKQVERMAILAKEGAVGNYQLSDLKGQLANEEIANINAENNLQQSKLALCQLMNIKYNSELMLDKTSVEMPTTKYADSTEDVYQSALKNFALVKSNELKIKSSDKAVKVARSGFYPTISFNANLGSDYSSLAQTLTPTNMVETATGDYVIINGNQSPVLQQQQNYSSTKTGYLRQLNNNLGTFAGINIRIPLFNGFQTKNNIKLSNISLTNAKLELENTKLQLRQNIEQAWLDMNSSFEKYKVLTGQVADFKESFRAAEVRFNAGVINSTEYLISKNNFDRASTNLAQAKYEYSFRTKVLDYYKGTAF